MATGPLQMLKPLRWFDSKLFLGEKETKIDIRGIAINSEAEVFLADCANGVVRAIDVRTLRLVTNDDAYRVPSKGFISKLISKVYSSTTELVCRVAYSSFSDTLLIGTELQVDNKLEFKELRLRSFDRIQTKGDGNGSHFKWVERHCYTVLPMGFEDPTRNSTCESIQFGTLQALSDGNLVLVVTLQWHHDIGSRRINETSYELRVLSVAADDSRTVQLQKRIPLPSNSLSNSICAKCVKDETWFATVLGPTSTVGHSDAEVVALYRIVGEEAKELLHCDISAPLRLLFFGDDSLLVYARTKDAKGWEVHELGIALDDNLLIKRRDTPVLSGRDTPDTGLDYLPLLCTANGVLVAWNIEHDTLSTYSLNQ